MSKVEIYTKATCPYCIKALEFLDKKKIQYHRIEVGNDHEKRTTLKEKANGRHTVPQIFINDKGIGGCDDLFALEEAGKLDAMLKG